MHLTRDVHERDIEPELALRIFDELSPVFDPTHFPISTADAVTQMIVIAREDLRLDARKSLFAILFEDHARKGIAGKFAELLFVLAVKHPNEAAAHTIERIFALSRIAEQPSRETVEKAPVRFHIGYGRCV